jgi:acyl-CoA thioesterase
VDELKDYFKNDRIAEQMGIELIEISPGRAVARMKLTEQHYNALDIAHGAALFALADVAFAAASNSHGTQAVGVNATISYTRAVSTGTLTAEANELSRARRLATYTVNITDDTGETAALFQGTVYRKNKPLHPTRET